MKKFKYKVLTCAVIGSFDDAVEQLNNDGFNGWELVSVKVLNEGEFDIYNFFLKKEI